MTLRNGAIVQRIEASRPNNSSVRWRAVESLQLIEVESASFDAGFSLGYCGWFPESCIEDGCPAGERVGADRRNRLSHLSLVAAAGVAGATASSGGWGLRRRFLGLRVRLAAGVLQTLQLALRPGVGTFQAALTLPKPI